jgi:hypothetical protein
VQHWYVYYKLTPTERTGLLERVRGMQRQLSQSADVQMRLLERTEGAETTTVMEVYEEIDEPQRFGALLDAAVHAAQLPAAHVAARRVERFRDA